MGSLFIQTWVWLLLATLLGVFIGWLIWGRSTTKEEFASLEWQLDECQRRCAELESGESRTVAGPGEAARDTRAEAAEPEQVPDDWRPVPETEPAGGADDLKRISGIGPVIERTLNGLGIYYYRQIASFTEENVQWVNNYLSFPGRIEREDWITQAGQLQRGEDTHFAKRYDRGDTGSGRSG